MAVRVGAYQRIVGVYWPTELPDEFLTARLDQVFSGTSGRESASGTIETMPVDTPFVQFYYTAITRGFKIFGTNPPHQNMPKTFSESFSPWEYSAEGAVEIENSANTYYAGGLQRMQPYEGESLGFGPTILSQYATTPLAFTVEYRQTPFTGGNRRFSNFWVGPTYFVREVPSSTLLTDFDYTGVLGTEIYATQTFDFSDVYVEYDWFGDGVIWRWNVVGLYVFPNYTTGTVDNEWEVNRMSLRLLLQRQPRT